MSILTPDELIPKIRKAFKNVPFPGKKIGESIDISMFVGKTWEAITFNDVNSVYNLFPFTDEAFHYYLPAFILIALQNGKKLNPLVFSGLIRELGSGGLPYRSKTKICKMFSKNQRELFIQFLEICSDLYPFPEIRQNALKSEMDLWKEAKQDLQKQINHAIEYWKTCS